ncbi:lipid A deacylase LpxR family protein [Sneathiella chinensis]|uniref:Membrane protein n=1 Tax=Sneathiella chinensis TaxID=349750 RepID=A0ABQ5U521_9PROT|nr:lipid A deacylase LpxR family protein [Sneathiella chinensis]GLQ06938.1 membrane protein [Sneathiella chinensis]
MSRQQPKPVLTALTAGMLGLMLVGPTTSVQAETRDKKGVLSVSYENDIFANQDNGYTNGVRLSWLSAESDVPVWLVSAANYLPFFETGAVKRYSLSLGQSMYSPDDISIPTLQEKDRPYAGWLYGSVGLISDSGSRLDNLKLTLGMVGPASLAEQTQTFVHETIGSTIPEGWDHQLNNEPGIILTYERKWRGLFEYEPFGFGADVTPHVGASLGNIFTHASVGATFRLGYDLPSDYGPPRIRPSLPGSDFFRPTSTLGGYLFAGVEGRAVARNIFLDGNTFSNSHSVDKYPIVGEVQAGVAITYGNTRLAYTHVLRSKEFVGQSGPEEFGAITLSFRF